MLVFLNATFSYFFHDVFRVVSTMWISLKLAVFSLVVINLLLLQFFDGFWWIKVFLAWRLFPGDLLRILLLNHNDFRQLTVEISWWTFCLPHTQISLSVKFFDGVHTDWKIELNEVLNDFLRFDLFAVNELLVKCFIQKFI